MAANRFNIPQLDLDLINWSQNVNARNDARARQRQQDWNKVYDMVAAYGERRRAEAEAEKARQKAAEEAAINRQFQAAEAQKNREFQAAQNAANRATQESNLKSQMDIERGKNIRRADAEANLIKAKLNKDLSVGGLQEADKQNIINEAQAALEANYARYGVDAPKFNLNAVPYKPVSVDTQALAQTAPSETITADNSVVVPPLGKTASQLAADEKELQQQAASVMENIRRMPNGTAKQNAMTEFNNTYGGNVKGYSTQDIKNAGFQIPMKTKGDIVPSDKVEYYKQWYKVGYDPVKRAQVIQGRK